MTFYLLQSLQIFTELSIETVGNALAECTVFPVLLSIEEPVWDLVLTWVEHDSFHTFDLIIVELTGSLDKIVNNVITWYDLIYLWEINVSLLADQVRESATDTSDGGHSEHNVSCTIDVCILDTKNMLELVWRNKRHSICPNISI